MNVLPSWATEKNWYSQESVVTWSRFLGCLKIPRQLYEREYLIFISKLNFKDNPEFKSKKGELCAQPATLQPEWALTVYGSFLPLSVSTNCFLAIALVPQCCCHQWHYPQGPLSYHPIKPHSGKHGWGYKEQTVLMTGKCTSSLRMSRSHLIP